MSFFTSIAKDSKIRAFSQELFVSLSSSLGIPAPAHLRNKSAKEPSAPHAERPPARACAHSA